MAAALQRDRHCHCGQRGQSNPPRPLHERHDEGDVGKNKHWHENDVEKEVRARLVVARILLPLPSKQL